MNIFKKMLSIVASSAVGLTVMASIPIQPIVSNAASEYVLLGDVNNDSSVTIADTACVIQFLSGTFTPSAHSFTAMDYNCDGIIDMTDANAIQYKLSYDLSDINIFKTLYTVPDNSSVMYRKHSCSSVSNYSYSTYTISAPSALTSSFASDIDLNSELSASKLVDELELTRTDEANTPDDENDACVELYSSGIPAGSGFVVGPHIIATAAHCLYGSNGFVNNLTVKLYKHQYVNGQLDKKTYTATAIDLHIPDNYIVSMSQTNVNYDYGLIYVSDFVDNNNNVLNVSNYSVNLGVMTDSFINAELGLITSVGYANTYYNNQITHDRFQSTGPIVNSIPEGEEPYRFNVEAAGVPGKSGGMNYYDSSYVTPQFSILTRSTLGITSGGVGVNTYCMRITPTLLRFYKANSNL